MRFRLTNRAVVTLIALLMGILAALHPFAKVTDPALGPVDMVICPFYLLAPILAGMGDAPFFISAITVNALLYALVAWKVVGVASKKTD
jgi:hypothetical protein